jgi:hypothetical protein
MRKNIVQFFLSFIVLITPLLASASELWEGSKEEVVKRLRAHNTYLLYEDLKNGFLPILHQDLHGDFEDGFGVMLKRYEEGCASVRLPATKENSHIACLYESLVGAPELEMQRINLYVRLDAKTHHKFFTPEFIMKIQS